MKNNITFIVLAAIIMIVGFFSIDVTQKITNPNTENSFRNIEHGENNAVYISDEREIINPMDNILPSNDNIPKLSLEIATNIVKALSRCDDTTYIAYGVDITDLQEAWQAGNNHFIYVHKWRYINKYKKQERLLDCIINTDDFSITYIRFYSDDNYELNANEMNSGIEKLDSESADFYPNIAIILQELESSLNYLTESEEVSEYNEYYNKPLFQSPPFYKYIGKEKINSDYIQSYNNVKQLIQYSGVYSKLCTFWIAPLDISNITVADLDSVYFDENNSINYKITKNAYPVNYLVEEFIESSSWFHPSYSSKDGRIYQTINLNSGELIVIYSVREDLIEGFCFNRK